MRLKSTRCIIHTWVELQLQPRLNKRRDGEGEANTGNHFKLDKFQACLDFTQMSSAHTSTGWHLAKIKRAHLLLCQRAPTVNKTGKQINVWMSASWCSRVKQRTNCCGAEARCETHSATATSAGQQLVLQLWSQDLKKKTVTKSFGLTHASLYLWIKLDAFTIIFKDLRF